MEKLRYYPLSCFGNLLYYLLNFHDFFPKVFWGFQKWTKKMSKIEKGRNTFRKMKKVANLLLT